MVLWFFGGEIVLKDEILGFDELFVGGEGFEVLFHVFDFDFTAELLEDRLEVVDV